MPAFAQSTSSWPQSCAICSKSVAIAAGSATLRQSRRHALGQCASAFWSVSMIQIFAPIAAKPSAIALPIPDAPAVINTFCVILSAL